jgi:hypothetical protein
MWFGSFPIPNIVFLLWINYISRISLEKFNLISLNRFSKTSENTGLSPKWMRSPGFEFSGAERISTFSSRDAARTIPFKQVNRNQTKGEKNIKNTQKKTEESVDKLPLI